MQTGKSRPWGAALTAGIVAFLLHSLVDFNMHIPANALMFCLLVSVALVLAQDVESRFPRRGNEDERMCEGRHEYVLKTAR